MKKYIDPNQQRYRFHVRETMNGYAIQVLNVERDENVPLNPGIASQLAVTLPDSYRMQCCTREAAEEQLIQLATLNGWTEVQ